jgi:hypothetical protein
VEKEIQMLRRKYYLPFIPGPTINLAKLPLYKIVAINVGADPVKRILINKLTDNSKSFVSYHDLEKIFQNAAHAEVVYKRLGFTCENHDTYLEVKRTINKL